MRKAASGRKSGWGVGFGARQQNGQSQSRDAVAMAGRGGRLLRTASASSRSRRASCSLLGNQPVSQCLRIGDVLLVAVRIDPNVWSLRVGLHLLVLTG